MQKNKLNLRTCGIHLLNPYKTVVSHLKCTVVCLVPWPLNESEAGGDLALIQTSLLFLCEWCCSHADK